MEPLMGVGLVMALLAGAALLASRRGRGPAFQMGFLKRRAMDNRMTVIERLPLTQVHVLHLVSVEGRELLVATHPQGVTFAAAGTALPVFSEVLRQQGVS